MKKILMFLAMISVLTSCYDEFRLDNDFSTVAFSNATGESNQTGVLWRTVVKGEGLRLDAGVYLGGVLNNSKERWADFVLDQSLLDGTEYTMLPSDYYTLSNDSRFVIPSGKSIGTVKVVLDSIKFLSDPLTLKPNYALPFKLTETSEDSILSSQSSQILVIKYMNQYDGFYTQEGTYETVSLGGETLNSGTIDNVLNGNTFSPTAIELDGSIFIGPDNKMSLEVNDDNTVSLAYVPNSEVRMPINVALTSTVIAPKVSSWENAEGIKDGFQPSSSGDKNGAAFGNWPNPNAWDYVDYEFAQPYDIYQSDIYWWTDGGGIQIPYNSYLEYWDLETEQWVLFSEDIEVNGVAIPANQYGIDTYTPSNKAPGTEADMFNVTTFKTVNTDKIRIHFISVESQGILEWQVWGFPAADSYETAAIESIVPNGANTYDPDTGVYTLNYTIIYKDLDYTTNVSTTLDWRNRVRDGVNEWRR